MARERRSWGQIRKLPSGNYQASYVGPDGQRRAAPRTFLAKDDAVAWLARHRRAIELGEWTPASVAAPAPAPSGSPTLRAYAQRWLAEKSNLKPRTRMGYEDLLRLHVLPTLGETKLVDLTVPGVRAWHASLGGATPTRNAHAYALLHAICATAVGDDLIAANPCRIKGAMSTKRRREIALLTPVELGKLADLMPPRLRMAVLLSGWATLRWGELAELRRRDVGNGVLHVRRAVVYRRGEFLVSSPKSHAGRRDVAVPPHLLEDLAAHLGEHVDRRQDALLFPAEGGGHITDYEFRRFFKAAAAEIGHPGLRPHDLRHCSAVLAAQAGATTAELMGRLGHSSPNMAMRYQHVAQGRDAEIARRLSDMA